MVNLKEELKEAYLLIQETALKNIEKIDKPKAIYVSGQTGSGKTKLIQHIIDKNNNSNIILIENDRWRKLHPRHKEILQEFGTDEVDEICRTIKLWREMLLNEIIKNKYSFIMHTSFTNFKKSIEQMQQLNNEGYEISVNFLACNEYESRLGNCSRYIDALKEREYCRIILNHDEVYWNLEHVIQQLEKENICNEINIYNRQNEKVYKYDNNGVLKVFQEERNKKWNKQKYDIFCENCKNLLQEKLKYKNNIPKYLDVFLENELQGLLSESKRLLE